MQCPKCGADIEAYDEMLGEGAHASDCGGQEEKIRGLNKLMDEVEQRNQQIIFQGKVKDMTREAITTAWLKATRPIEPLEAVDFSKN